MKTNSISALILNLIFVSLGLVAQSKEPVDLKTCKDCCTEGHCKNGKGTWIFANGDTYSGEFLEGNLEGEGTYTFLNGDKYTGDFENSNLNGEGTYTYFSGDKYIGEYDSGLKNGEGTYSYANGDKYSGEFKNGKPNGVGTFTFTDGEKYFGEWKEGKRHGKGTYTFSKGKKLVGLWEEGNFKSPSTLAEMAAKKIEWSPYQGFLNWDDAKEKCASLQMRLPRRRELRKAFKTKLLESWKSDGTYYWTSDLYLGNSIFYYFIDRGILDYFSKDVARHVRCIR